MGNIDQIIVRKPSCLLYKLYISYHATFPQIICYNVCDSFRQRPCIYLHTSMELHYLRRQACYLADGRHGTLIFPSRFKALLYTAEHLMCVVRGVNRECYLYIFFIHSLSQVCVLSCLPLVYY